MKKIYTVIAPAVEKGCRMSKRVMSSAPRGAVASACGAGGRYLHEAEAHGQAAGVGRVGGAGQQRARAAQRRVRRRAPRRVQRLQPAPGDF